MSFRDARLGVLGTPPLGQQASQQVAPRASATLSGQHRPTLCGASRSSQHCLSLGKSSMEDETAGQCVSNKRQVVSVLGFCHFTESPFPPTQGLEGSNSMPPLWFPSSCSRRNADIPSQWTLSEDSLSILTNVLDNKDRFIPITNIPRTKRITEKLKVHKRPTED